MPAQRYNLLIEQGATLSQTFAWKDSAGDPKDLTGYKAKAQVRKTKRSSVVIMEFDSEDDSIELGGEEGTIILKATAEQTAAVSESGFWDLELTDPDGEVVRLVEGRMTLSTEVTRA